MNPFLIMYIFVVIITMYYTIEIAFEVVQE